MTFWDWLEKRRIRLELQKFTSAWPIGAKVAISYSGRTTEAAGTIADYLIPDSGPSIVVVAVEPHGKREDFSPLLLRRTTLSVFTGVTGGAG